MSSSIYANLNVSPKKKRSIPKDFDESTLTLTPKRLRIAPLTPPPTGSRRGTRANVAAAAQLPDHLSRLVALQTALYHAMTHSLATCAISPTADSGLIRNVLNHLSLTNYAGFTTSFEIDDLKRLCWVWEWDAKSLPVVKQENVSLPDDVNPFLEPKVSPAEQDWTRGSMGLIVSSTTYFSKRDRIRVPAYGIGIEVEMDIDKELGCGMAAVARWTGASELRRTEFRLKLEKWVTLNSAASSVPFIPLADIPALPAAPKMSSLTRALASCSPEAFSLPSFSGPPTLPNPKSSLREIGIPFPALSGESSSLSKQGLLFPQTPRRNKSFLANSTVPSTPSTIHKFTTASTTASSDPSTPVHQRGANALTHPATPSSSRRQALYDRIRQKSLTSPVKSLSSDVSRSNFTRDQILKMSQDELRRRCLLGRLSGVAESVWMLFSTPITGSSGTPIARKRKALPLPEVIAAVMKSSPVPISTAETKESLSLLSKLCPFFLRQMTIANAEWLEMPSTTASNSVDAPIKHNPVIPSIPGSQDINNRDALVNRSPRRVRKEAGGLREVREIIRRELEFQD